MSVENHLSDLELLQLADFELPPERAVPCDTHLAGCLRCQTRQNELLTGLAHFSAARATALNVPVSSEAEAWQRLQVRMQALAPAPPSPSQWTWPSLALAAGLALAGVWWLADHHDRPVKPNARLTPGATLAMSREELCAVPDADESRLVPAALAGQVFDNYGIRPTPRRYEVDYLIAPALGGATDVRNLWPQPYHEGVWNAGVKDALENQLRRLVCAGAVDLPTAQQEIAADWIAAYRKYFRTEVPLAAHATYRKDLPWE